MSHQQRLEELESELSETVADIRTLRSRLEEAEETIEVSHINATMNVLKMYLVDIEERLWNAAEGVTTA